MYADKQLNTYTFFLWHRQSVLWHRLR